MNYLDDLEREERAERYSDLLQEADEWYERNFNDDEDSEYNDKYAKIDRAEDDQPDHRSI